MRPTEVSTYRAFMTMQQVTTDRTRPDDWRVVDAGWGRSAVDFATLSEPSNCREYVALHQHLNIAAGDRVLDVACGAGLAIELAAARGASCAGIDASPRLVRVAQDRSPDADVRVGDMHALPWADASFDVVTSCRGIWGTTPDALAEVQRVLVPGGRVGLTVWGHIKQSGGAWALAPFALAAQAKVANQAAMVSLGRPGAGEELLARMGFVDIERVEIPFVWEFADPDSYVRAIAATGPAHEAIQAVGDREFRAFAHGLGAERVRDGLPLRAPIAVVGYLARKAASAPAAHEPRGFLPATELTEDVQHLFDDDMGRLGYVMNLSHVWAHQPQAHSDLFDLLGRVAHAGALTLRERAVLIAACAATLGDSYCSLAWGARLAGEAGAAVAAGVLRGDDRLLGPAERELAAWARQITGDPNSTGAGDVERLRTAGFDDGKIFAATMFVGLRIAFSTVNDALGVLPDAQLGEAVPGAVRAAVTYGRPIGEDASTKMG
jgi:SAM-dependent methyltransferase/alkylhydroperoxidase family enzyme